MPVTVPSGSEFSNEWHITSGSVPSAYQALALVHTIIVLWLLVEYIFVSSCECVWCTISTIQAKGCWICCEGGDPYFLDGDGVAGIISGQWMEQLISGNTLLMTDHYFSVAYSLTELLEVFFLQEDDALDAVSHQQVLSLESEQLFLIVSTDVVTGNEDPKTIQGYPMIILVDLGSFHIFISSYMSCQAKINENLYLTVYIIAQCLFMEKLHWHLTVSTMYLLSVRYLKVAKGDKELANMAFFYCELALVQYTMLIYPPSVTAVAAVYAARSALQIKPLWTDILEYVQVTVRLPLLIVQSMFRFQGASTEVSSWAVHFVQSCPWPLIVHGCLLSMPGEHWSTGKMQVQDTRNVGAVGKPRFVLLFYNLVLADP